MLVLVGLYCKAMCFTVLQQQLLFSLNLVLILVEGNVFPPEDLQVPNCIFSEFLKLPQGFGLVIRHIFPCNYAN